MFKWIRNSRQLAEQNFTNLPNRILPTCRTEFYQLAEQNLANLPILCLTKRFFDAIVMVRKSTEEFDAI